MSNTIEERLDGIEARIERLEKLYGIDLGINITRHHKTMTIYWSRDDQCFLVAVPELRGQIMNWQNITHGDTYEEAARMGTEAIEVALADDITEQTGE